MVRSISKTPVSVDVATDIASDAFGDGISLVELTELTEGWFNAAYMMTLDRRPAVCVEGRAAARRRRAHL